MMFLAMFVAFQFGWSLLAKRWPDMLAEMRACRPLIEEWQP